MPLDTVTALVQAVQRSGVLEPVQFDELGRFQGQFKDPKALARELMQRGWVTPFQVNQLFQGREDLVLDQYVLLERLGEGGMGTVFKARHRRLKRIDALKVIRKDKLTNVGSVQRFHQEAEAAARVSHPNIVGIHDASESGGTHFLAMEYVEGIDLAKMVKQCGRLPISQACAYIRQAAQGLQHAHERGLVHRDIKPSNLFVNLREGVVKVLDMGLARLSAVTPDGDTSALTQTGAVIGTPDFVAPEQAKDSRLADIRADIYSLGCTLYFLLTGKPPFPGGTLTEKLLKIQLDEPERIERLRPEIPAALAELVRKLMAKKPEERVQTAKEVVRLLEPFATSDGKVSPEQSAVLIGGPSTGSASSTLTMSGGRRALILAHRFWGKLSRRGKIAVVAGAALAVLFLVMLVGDVFRGPPLERLDAVRIPMSERFFWQPPEVVAVFGEHRLQHWGPVRGLAFSPDGKVVASGAGDRIIHLWDVATGQVRTTCRGHSSGITAVAFAPNGKAVYSGSGGGPGEVKIWDPATGREKGTLQGSSNYVYALACAPDGQTLAAAIGGALRLWDLTTEKQRAAFSSNDYTIHALAFSPDSQVIAAACTDRAIRLFDAGTAKPTSTIYRAHDSSVVSIAFSPNGKSLVSCGYDRLVKLWDVERGEAMHTYSGHSSEVYGVAFSPDGKTVASAGYDRSVRLWNAAKPDLLATIMGHTSPVSVVAFAPDSKTLASGGPDCAVKLWDVPSRTELNGGKLHSGRAACVAFSPDGRTLVSAGDDRIVKFWDLNLKKKFPANKIHTAGVSAVSFSPDSKRLASASHDGTIRLWDTASAEVSDSLPGRYGLIGVDFTRDGKRLISATSVDITVWDVATLRPKFTTPRVDGGDQGRSQGYISAILHIPDGDTIAYACNNEVKLIDAGTGAEKNTLKGFKSTCALLALSPDGRALAVGTIHTNEYKSEIKVVELASGKELATLDPGGSVTALAYAPNSKLLASANGLGKIILWESGQAVHEWQLPGPVYSLDFAADGRHLASANADGTLYIFRLPQLTPKTKK